MTLIAYFNLEQELGLHFTKYHNNQKKNYDNDLQNDQCKFIYHFAWSITQAPNP